MFSFMKSKKPSEVEGRALAVTELLALDHVYENDLASDLDAVISDVSSHLPDGWAFDMTDFAGVEFTLSLEAPTGHGLKTRASLPENSLGLIERPDDEAVMLEMVEKLEQATQAVMHPKVDLAEEIQVCDPG